MNCEDIFKLDMSLEHLCGITIAISLWERQDVKDMMGNGFCGGARFFYDQNKNEKEKKLVSSGEKILKYVFKQLGLMIVPKLLVPHVESLIIEIGQKIFSWRNYVTAVLKLDLKFAEKIFWTSYGQVDEVRILQEFWLSDETLPDMGACKCFLGTSTCRYCLVSMYGEENFVINHLSDMKKRIFPYLNLAHKNEKWTPYKIIAIWVLFCTNQKKTPAMRELKNFRKQANDLPITNLLLKCISQGNVYGVQYFWSKMNENDKIKTTFNAAKRSLNFKEYSIYQDADTSSNSKINRLYFKEVAIKLVLFFISHMTEIQKIEFVTLNFSQIFKLIFSNWPYRELCEKFLYGMWDHVSQVQQIKILSILFKNVMGNRESSALFYFIKTKSYENTFKNLIEKSSRETKFSFVSNDHFFILRELYEAFNNDLLKLIMNDGDLKNYRNMMLGVGNKYMKKFSVKKDYESLNKFIKDMKLSNEELKSFKRSCNVLYKFLICGELAAAEDHLNWLGDTEDERVEFKNQVNATEIIFFLIQNLKFEIADQFLIWRFDTEEERKGAKNLVASENFLINKIFEIWSGANGDPNLFSQTCSNLLDWYFESGGEVDEFKRTKLIDDQFLIEKFWNAQIEPKTLKNLNEFLKFCSMSQDEIEVMKINIANNFNWWVDTYALEKVNHLKMVENLIEWVYGGNNRDRKRAVKNYMNSSHGSLLCIKILKNYNAKWVSDVVHSFNFWISHSLNFKELKMHLDQADNSLIGPKTIQRIKFLLNIRDDYKSVTCRDILNSEHFA